MTRRAEITAAVAPIQPRWLRLADAVRYSGLSKSRLMDLAQGREIVGGQDDGDRRGKGEGTWVFDRESIDAWRMRQLGGGTIHDHAAALARSVLG
ncbi:MAG: hypothetical protein KQJ78_23970 [Deltaproteobacteria bacterium]|nr:hypothetical protein [Deltaproteobacteria bacterium]